MTKLIPILSGRCLVVELPEVTAMECILHNENGQNYLAYFEGLVHRSVNLPPGNWRIIGVLSEVTDAELADVTGFYYNKYNERYVEMPTSAMCATPVGDIEDAIRAEGYYLDKNPYGEEPKPENTPNYAYSVDVRIWESAQPRVLDRSRCLLLGREI